MKQEFGQFIQQWRKREMKSKGWIRESMKVVALMDVFTLHAYPERRGIIRCDAEKFLGEKCRDAGSTDCRYKPVRLLGKKLAKSPFDELLPHLGLLITNFHL